MDHLGEPVSHEETRADATTARRVGRSIAACRGARRCSSRPARARLAASAPYLARLGNGARTASTSRGAELDLGAGSRLAGAADRHARAVGREREPAHAESDLQLGDHARSSCTTPGTPNDITDYAGLARGIFVERAEQRLHRHRVQLAHRSRTAASTKAGGRRTTRPGCRTPVSATGSTCMGAHALHFNADTIGIGLMGDYSDVAPTPAMVDALLTLHDVEVRALGYRPARRGPYVNARTSAVDEPRTTSAVTATPTRPRARATRSRRCCRCSASQVASRLAVGSTGYWIASSAGQLVAFGEPAQRGRRVGRALATRRSSA